ncbi:hypothetical protein [Mammaliicoccus sciuri]|uniref:hypothetical protein n=1 Tax=Mammaliicoccus sciuri TaxID=1296 RepID=UPI000D1FD94E|nr:hypothetical protein [Mammaliicoccus sciuri]PTJ54188.1 hypothetical protein BU012_00910 [Mammaliicoccus sciuri]
MNITEVAKRFDITEDEATEYIIANGFSITSNDYDTQQIYLLGMYHEYVQAKKDAAKARETFRYQDGEEMVDKSKQFDAFRAYANDMFNRWQKELAQYNSDEDMQGSQLILRKRAKWLDA